MRLVLIAAGTRLPQWVNDGYSDYAHRLTQDYRLELKEIPLAQRSSGDLRQAIAKEGERMSAALPHIDLFESGHNLEALERLAAALGRLR